LFKYSIKNYILQYTTLNKAELKTEQCTAAILILCSSL